MLKSGGWILHWQSFRFLSYTSSEGKDTLGVMEKVTSVIIWKADGFGAELEGTVMEKPHGGGTACGGCGRLHGLCSAWQEHLVWICLGANRSYPWVSSLMGSVEFCGPTSVAVVHVCGCGSGSKCPMVVRAGCGFSSAVPGLVGVCKGARVLSPFRCSPLSAPSPSVLWRVG